MGGGGKFGGGVWGVGTDTSESMVDRSLQSAGAGQEARGVAAELVFLTRKALDGEGFGHVKIVVSGGFCPERIARFESRGVPVDAYGVGSSLMRGCYDFTADVVLLDGKPCAKAGRHHRPNPRMEIVEFGTAETLGNGS